MNRSENAYVIKKRVYSAEEEVDAIRTDNFNACVNSYIDFCDSVENNLAENVFTDLSSLILNCRSILPKQAEFCATVATYDPDIIFASETWFFATISSCQFLPNDYIAYRCDRSDGYGGVMVAHK